MKKLLLSLFILTILAGFSLTDAWSKGHVPLDQAQVCRNGEVINIQGNSLDGAIARGDCQLPACDGNNVFMPGDDCSAVDIQQADGTCDLGDGADVRDSANGITRACTVLW